MDLLWLILLVVLIVALFGGGFYAGPSGAYPLRAGGWGIGTILVILLIVLLVRGL